MKTTTEQRQRTKPIIHNQKKSNQEQYHYKAYQTDKTRVKIIRYKVSPPTSLLFQTRQDQDYQPTTETKPNVQSHQHKEQTVQTRIESALTNQLETVCELLVEMAREIVKPDTTEQRSREIQVAINLLHSQQSHICNNIRLIHNE